MEPISLKVDIADAQDVRAKLAEAEAWLAEHEQKRDQLVRLVTRLQAISDDASTPEHPRALPAPSIRRQEEQRRPSPGRIQELVVEVVNRQMRHVRAKDVTNVLRQEGHDVGTDTVSNALWYAAEKADLIQRVERGSYAPKGYKKPLSATDVAAGAVAGLAGAALLSSALGAGGGS